MIKELIKAESERRYPLPNKDIFGPISYSSESGKVLARRKAFEDACQWAAEQHRAEQQKESAVWRTDQYERLLEKVKAGKDVICWIDYNGYGDIQRDLCKARRIGDIINFQSRGITYLTIFKESWKAFGSYCEKFHVQWLDESQHPTP